MTVIPMEGGHNLRLPACESGVAAAETAQICFSPITPKALVRPRRADSKSHSSPNPPSPLYNLPAQSIPRFPLLMLLECKGHSSPAPLQRRCPSKTGSISSHLQPWEISYR
jgi:hypothetical protein